MSEIATVPLAGYREYPVEEMRRRLKDFYDDVSREIVARHYSKSIAFFNYEFDGGFD